MRQNIRLSVFAGSILFASSLLQASGYGLSGDYSTGRTVWPNMFGGIDSSNPANLGIQENIKYSTILHRNTNINIQGDCQRRKDALEKEYSNVNNINIFNNSKSDIEYATKMKRRAQYEQKMSQLEAECDFDNTDNSFGWQMFSLGAVIEIGDIDRLKDNIDKYKIDVTPSNASEVYSYADSLNEFLTVSKDDLYGTVNAYANILSPMIFRLDSGTYSIGIGVKSESKFSVVGGKVGINEIKLQELVLKQVADPTYMENHPDEVADALQMTTNLYIKDAAIAKAYIGYSNDIYHNDYGVLNFGGRLNFYKARLSKVVLPFKKYIKEELKGEDSTETMEDDITDADTISKDTSMVGLDLGVSWQSTNYILGVYVSNINEPEAKYPTLADECQNITDPSDQENCYYELSLSDVIDTDETYKMQMLPTISGELFDEDNRWRMAFSYDLTKVKSPVGENYQWATFNLGYSSRVNRDTWYKYFIPDWRLGINQNLTGSNITYYTLGLGFYGLNIDFMADKRAFSSNKETRDDARGYGTSISYGFNF